MYKKHLHLVFLLLLYGCTKAEEDCQANSFQYPTQVCIQLYEPVSGCNNITYSNACIAESWGVVPFSQGACTN